jgi:hypothetical protein
MDLNLVTDNILWVIIRGWGVGSLFGSIMRDTNWRPHDMNIRLYCVTAS